MANGKNRFLPFAIDHSPLTALLKVVFLIVEVSIVFVNDV